MKNIIVLFFFSFLLLCFQNGNSNDEGNINRKNKSDIIFESRRDTSIINLICKEWVGSLDVDFYIQFPDSFVNDDFGKYLHLTLNGQGDAYFDFNHNVFHNTIINNSCLSLNKWDLNGIKNDTLVLNFLHKKNCNFCCYDRVIGDEQSYRNFYKTDTIIIKHLILKLSSDELILEQIYNVNLIDTIKFISKDKLNNQIKTIQEVQLEKFNAVRYDDLINNNDIFFYNSQPYTGNTIQFSDNYTYSFKKWWTGKLKNGRKHGEWIEWSESGNKIRRESYQLGKKDGQWLSWDKNNKIIQEENYNNGNRDGLFVYWDVLYREKYKECYYKEDKPDGKWIEWDMGDPCLTDDSRIQVDGFYKEGEKEGIWTYWYSMNELSGYCRGLYYSSQSEKAKENINKFQKYVEKYGLKQRVESYTNGVPHGVFTKWYINGYKESEQNYQDGKPDGKWSYWDNRGNIIKEEIYNNDKLIEK